MPSKQHQRWLTFTHPVPHAQQKFRELIIYIARACESAEYFGAVKLNKILYYADFRAFERFGVPITGAAYFRLPRGPAPRALLYVRKQLSIEGSIRIEYRPIYNHTQERVVAQRAPHVDLFTGDELAIVDEVINELWNETATDVTNISHDIIWRTLRNKDPIPYESAYLDKAPLTDVEITRSHELAQKFGWNAK